MVRFKESWTGHSYNVEWIINLLQWQQENNLSDNSVQQIALGLITKILKRIDGGDIINLLRIPTKKTLLLHKQVSTTLLQEQQGK